MKLIKTPDAHIDDCKATWCGKDCTLDGRTARIVGRSHPFATVVILAGPGPVYGIEFSWQAVARVMQNGKAFKS